MPNFLKLSDIQDNREVLLNSFENDYLENDVDNFQEFDNYRYNQLGSNLPDQRREGRSVTEKKSLDLPPPPKNLELKFDEIQDLSKNQLPPTSSSFINLHFIIFTVLLFFMLHFYLKSINYAFGKRSPEEYFIAGTVILFGMWYFFRTN